MRKTKLLVLALTGALLVPGGPHAVRTAHWETTGREAVAKGTPTDVTIGPLGFLELAPRFEPFGEISEYYAWSLLSDGRGTLYVGTGDQGKIFRVERSGKTVLLFDSLELDVLSLALDGKGNLYAGTSPDGIVYRIDREGNARTFFDSPESYVWDLEFDEKGDLYAATGEKGKVYRIDPSGNAELFYDSPETNVLCIVRDPAGGRFLLGGDGSGLVLSVDAKGTARVVFDSPRTEVGDLLLDGEGRIFVGCSGGENAKNNSEGQAKTPPKKALLYRIEPNGTAVLLWESESEFIYAIAPDAEGAVLVGTGSPGSLVRVTKEGEATEIRRMTEAQVLSIARTDEGTVLATGNQGKLYRLGPERSEEGMYDSEVRDVGNLSRWGSLRWWGTVPEGTRARFSTRSGNTEDPDPTWSEWEAILEGESGGAVQSPPSRFIQWRVELEGKGERSPRIDRVALAFKEYNLPPRVLSVGVTRAGDPFYEGPSDPRPEPLFQVLPDGARVELMPAESPEWAPGEPVEIWARSVRIARWQASDANGDDLLFDFFYRAEGDAEWILLEEEIKLSFYSWDTRSMPDGDYRVRVVARDFLSNSEATAASGERVSEPFLVDNTLPVIEELSVRREGDVLRVRARARDAASPIRTAEAIVGAGKWRPVDPKDEVFDDRSEEFDFTLKAGEGKETVVALRVSDRAGNLAVLKAIVR
ncbi:MAG: SMP-30/gluconolactonase/LRE family protein [Candidatus Eisenbacteria bacterium]